MGFMFDNVQATTEIYTYVHPRSTHDSLPIYPGGGAGRHHPACRRCAWFGGYLRHSGGGEGGGFRPLGYRPAGGTGLSDRPQPAPAGCVRRSEEHTSELQSLMRISYAVFCLKNTNSKYKTSIQLNIPNA